MAKLRQLARRGTVLALVPLLSGCIAVAALPILAGGAMFAGGNVKIRAATPRSKVSGTVRVDPAADERTSGAAIVDPAARCPRRWRSPQDLAPRSS